MTIRYVTIAALGAALGSVAADTYAADQQAEVVIEWNQLLQANLPATAGLQSLRYYAMMHIAIFDAVNSIAREYSSYRVTVPSSRGASQEAASAQAAHDVLAALIPSTGAVQTFDAALAAKLATIEPGRAAQGISVGKKAAAAILAWRQNDGWEVAPPAYVLPPLSGLWQPTPPAFAPAGFTQFPGVEPFALLTATQFLPRRLGADELRVHSCVRRSEAHRRCEQCHTHARTDSDGTALRRRYHEHADVCRMEQRDARCRTLSLLLTRRYGTRLYAGERQHQ